MADTQKYYYMRLKDNFFDTNEIVILESLPDGYLYSNILLKLYLRSLKDNGKLMFNDRIPYNSQMIATITRHQIGTVEKALQVFKDMGLIEILDTGAIYMSDIQKYIGKSSTEADRQRLYDRKIKEERKLLEDPNKKSCKKSLKKSSKKSTPEIEIEIDTERELEREKENIPTVNKESSPPVITFLTNKSQEFPISQDLIDQMQECYPAVDVYGEMLNMKAWLIANPKNRKTYGGMTRFINNWLSRSQNRSHVTKKKEDIDWDAAMKWAEEEDKKLELERNDTTDQ